MAIFLNYWVVSLPFGIFIRRKWLELSHLSRPKTYRSVNFSMSSVKSFLSSSELKRATYSLLCCVVYLLFASKRLFYAAVFPEWSVSL